MPPLPPSAPRHETGWVSVQPCAWGQLLVARTTQGICALTLGDDAAGLQAALLERWAQVQWVQESPDTVPPGWKTPSLQAIADWVERPQQPWHWPLDIRGTDFQKRVWDALRTIPVGRTVSYQALAQQLQHPRATRAVAQACAANPLALIIPCHRVVRQDGQLGGYRWGLERKRRLLALEAQLAA